MYIMSCLINFRQKLKTKIFFEIVKILQGGSMEKMAKKWNSQKPNILMQNHARYHTMEILIYRCKIGWFLDKLWVFVWLEIVKSWVEKKIKNLTFFLEIYFREKNWNK